MIETIQKHRWSIAIVTGPKNNVAPKSAAKPKNGEKPRSTAKPRSEDSPKHENRSKRSRQRKATVRASRRLNLPPNRLCQRRHQHLALHPRRAIICKKPTSRLSKRRRCARKRQTSSGKSSRRVPLGPTCRNPFPSSGAPSPERRPSIPVGEPLSSPGAAPSQNRHCPLVRLIDPSGRTKAGSAARWLVRQGPELW